QSGIYYGQAVPRAGTNFIDIAASTFFSVAIQIQPPALRVTPIGNNVLLSWSTNHIGYTLEATADLGSPLDWSPIPGIPTIVNNQNTITNNAASGNRFFRLKR